MTDSTPTTPPALRSAPARRAIAPLRAMWIGAICGVLVICGVGLGAVIASTAPTVESIDLQGWQILSLEGGLALVIVLRVLTLLHRSGRRLRHARRRGSRDRSRSHS
jgi:hypothetical protein